jgi:plasmid stability protein
MATLNIRNVPEDLYQSVKVSVAKAGLNLREWVLAKLAEGVKGGESRAENRSQPTRSVSGVFVGAPRVTKKVTREDLGDGLSQPKSTLRLHPPATSHEPALVTCPLCDGRKGDYIKGQFFPCGRCKGAGEVKEWRG